MSEDYKVDEEKIVALLLDELTEEEKSLVENAILQDSRLQEMESVLADIMRGARSGVLPSEGSREGRSSYPRSIKSSWCYWINGKPRLR